MTVSLRLVLGSLALLALVVGLPVLAVLMIAGQPDPGDCVTATGADGRVSVVSCTDPSAQGRVLRRLDESDDVDGDCRTVPGSTEQVPINGLDGEDAADMCVGPKDVPPELSPAVAVPGTCLTDVRAEPVRQTFCSAPGAYRIVARGREIPLVPELSGCSRVPGSTETYQWQLVSTRFAAFPMVTRTFCVAPADPATAPPDRVRPGG